MDGGLVMLKYYTISCHKTSGVWMLALLREAVLSTQSISSQTAGLSTRTNNSDDLIGISWQYR
jgi:hypothetical protein